jgi:apolipoprotein D and lipocalin family protein
MACFLALCSSPGRGKPLRSAARVDLHRYMGRWHVIACVENSVERDFVDAVESYSLRDDGNIGVTFRWREKHFIASEKTHEFIGWVSDVTTNAQWKMRLVPFFTVSYVILATHPDYEWSAVGHPSRKFGWVLARERTLSAATYEEIMEIFRQQGYDTRQFMKVPQLAFECV